MPWGFSQGDYGVYEVCKMVLKVSFQNLFSWGWFPSASSVKSIIVSHYNGCIDRTFTYWQNILIQVIKCSRSGTRSDIDQVIWKLKNWKEALEGKSQRVNAG